MVHACREPIPLQFGKLSNLLRARPWGHNIQQLTVPHGGDNPSPHGQPLRIVRPGAWCHVTSRGNERRSIFRDDRESLHFLELLGEMSALLKTKLHAYVLMDNHYHLLLQLSPTSLSRALQWLNGAYSIGFNFRHRRCGHLVQGRFKAIIVDPQAWALTLSRYIH